MRTVSTIQKLHMVLGIAFILAGATRVVTQAQPVMSWSSSNDPEKAGVAKPVMLDLSTDEKTSEICRDHASATSAVRNLSTTSARTTAGKTVVPTQAGPADKWHFIFSPYFWMAGLHGTTGTPERTVVADESFSDIFGSLNFAFMALFEARKGKWLVLTDVEFVSLEDDRATPGPLFSAVNAKIKMFNFKPEVGYRVFADFEKGNFIDVVGGARIWHISTDLTFSPGILPAAQVDASRSWVDAVGGLRGKASLSEKVFSIGKLDLGGGGSKFTYQLFGGLGYNLNRRIALVGGYRVLDVNYDKNNFVYDMNQRGPIIGAAFRF